jgi:hypothetical protein
MEQASFGGDGSVAPELHMYPGEQAEQATEPPVL